jgi:hypothetical protein
MKQRAHGVTPAILAAILNEISTHEKNRTVVTFSDGEEEEPIGVYVDLHKTLKSSS